MPPMAQFTVWDPEKGIAPASALAGDAVIHLAGEPVSQRWTPEVKRRIRDSRVLGTARLIEGIRASEKKPRVLVSASAVGYYGDRGDEELTEESGAGKTFLAAISKEWEEAALKARELGLRVVLVRIGIVLGAGGGALEKMLPPFRAGVGGRLGSGEQWMPWIHLDDMVNLFQRALEDEAMSGAVNGTAPNPVRNAEFTATLGRALRRPALLPVPRLAVRLLYGEMSEILFHSQRVIPRAALKAGFEFRHPELFAALKSIVG
jgi:uncharacterized protein (TIGR01777 family)